MVMKEEYYSNISKESNYHEERPQHTSKDWDDHDSARRSDFEATRSHGNEDYRSDYHHSYERSKEDHRPRSHREHHMYDDKYHDQHSSERSRDHTREYQRSSLSYDTYETDNNHRGSESHGSRLRSDRDQRSWDRKSRSRSPYESSYRGSKDRVRSVESKRLKFPDGRSRREKSLSPVLDSLPYGNFCLRSLIYILQDYHYYFGN